MLVPVITLLALTWKALRELRRGDTEEAGLMLVFSLILGLCVLSHALAMWSAQ